MEPIDLNDVAHCRQRAADEEDMALRARSPEAGELHWQMAMLYKAHLELLKTRRS